MATCRKRWRRTSGNDNGNGNVVAGDAMRRVLVSAASSSDHHLPVCLSVYPCETLYQLGRQQTVDSQTVTLLVIASY